MASTPVEFEAPSGLTLTLELYAFGSDTIVNGAGDSCTEATNRHGLYSATVTETLTGLHNVIIVDGSNNLIATYSVGLADSTAIHRCGETVVAVVETNVGTPAGGSVSVDIAAIDTVVDSILVDTAEIGVNGAGLTSISLGSQSFDLTGDITGDITGNLSGSVGSITGHTPQTGNTYALAAGATGFAAIDTVVDAILVDTATTIPATIAAIDTVVDAILVDTAEIGVNGAGLTDINLPNQTMDITGDILGNISGSISGSVGSITGHTAQTGDTYALANGTAGFVAIDTVVDSILVDTTEIGVAGAGLTNINLPNQTMDITGNLSGSVGSVTGAVGSVTGAVGSVTGAVGSVTGAVGSVVGHTVQTGDTYALANGTAGFAAIDTVVDSILVDTAEIGTAGAGLTNINLPNQTMDITGNLSGSVGSVTGAVGSVTGAVGSVTGAVGSVTGAVGSVVGHTVQTGDTYALAAGATGFAAIDTVVDSILVDTAEIGTAGAGLTNINLPNQTMDITGNLSGSVGSVTGAVGSVTGSVGSVTGAVGSVVGHTVQTGDTYALANGTAGFVAIDTVVDSILVDTTEIGVAGAGLTNINLPNQTMDITGNLSGSVGSVTGHTVQTGDTYALANGAAGFVAIDTVVDSILVDTGTTIPATLAALNDISISDILTTQMTEAYAADGVAPTLAQAIFNLQQTLGDFSITGTTITVNKLDGIATAMTYELDSAEAPTSRTRTS